MNKTAHASATQTSNGRQLWTCRAMYVRNGCSEQWMGTTNKTRAEQEKHNKRRERDMDETI